MKGNQTPQKELPRSTESAIRRVKEPPTKSSSEQVKKSLKIPKKCLDNAFESIPEDQPPHSRKSVSTSNDSIPKKCLDNVFESIPEDQSPHSRKSLSTPNDLVKSSADQHKQLSEVLELSMLPDLPLDTFGVSPSSTISEESQEASTIENNVSVDCETPKTGSVDVGIAISFIREAMLQAWSSSVVDLRSKKILDSVIKIVIDDLYGFSEEQVRPEVISTKLHIRLLNSLLWLVPVAVVAVALSNMFAGYSFPDPPPT